MSVLNKCELFEGMGDQEINSLIPCLRPSVRSFSRGELISQAGQLQYAIGIVLDGEVQIVKEDIDGSRLILGMLGPGELFGEVSAYAGQERWPSTVVAMASGQVLFLHTQKLLEPCCQTCDFHRRLIRNMLGIVARKAMEMNRRIHYLRIGGMRQKLAAYLYEQYRQTGVRTFLLQMNREQMADYLNVSRPSMSRELGRMKEDGIIDFYKSSFTIRNVDALRDARG